MEILSVRSRELLNGFDNIDNFRLIQLALWMSYCVMTTWLIKGYKCKQSVV